MRRRIAILLFGLCLGGLAAAGPAGAQPSCLDLLDGAPLGSSCTQINGEAVLSEGDGFGPILNQPDPGNAFGGFIAIFILFGLIGLGVTIWKFTAIRDMGVRRGMSRRDASTAAFFSDETSVLGMILKDEPEPPSPLVSPQPQAAKPAIEDRLAKVDSLRERGLISDAEATSRRGEILDEI